jgi:REP element-mobilizing transposase RayT
MTYNPAIHHRRSIRLKGYDYSQAGAYFITVVVQGRENLFGEIVNGEMRLNAAGEIVLQTWNDLPRRFPSIELDASVIMPNHGHGIIVIGHDTVGATLASPDASSNDQGAASSAPTNDAPTLAAIMRAFKSISAISVNRQLAREGQPLWQRNYYEHIIRDEKDLNRIREYIINNPLKWESDTEYAASKR